jgi:hypothetical protein
MAGSELHLRAIANADGAVILDTKRGTLSRLNSTGRYVWEALKRGDEVPIIAERLSRETGAPASEVEQDIRAFAEDLKAQMLIG